MKDDDTPEKVEVKTDARPKKQKRQANGAPLPFLLEFTYTMSTLILIFLALAIMITSIFAGAGLFAVLLRTSVAIIVVGGLLMLISSQISSGLLFAVRIQQEAAEKKLEEPEDTSNHLEQVTLGQGDGQRP